MTRIEKEKSKNEKFAEEHNISNAEMNEIYEEIFEQLPADMDEDKKTIRALRKTRGTLRRRAQIKYEDAFVLFRFRNQNYNLYAWNKVDEYVKENGLEKAQEVGMVDAEGNYLHTSGFNVGEKIDKSAIFGSAIGIFQDADNNTIPKWISIGQYNIKNKLPLCREIQISVKEGKKPGPLFPDTNLVYFNSAKVTDTDPICSPDELNTYESIIQDLFGDIIFNDVAELKDYCSDRISDRQHFAGIHAICTGINARDLDSNIPIDFEIGDDIDDIEELTIWAEPDVFKGLSIEEGVAGILFVSGYLDNNDNIGFNIGGFLPYDDI